jgi:hypothetical protein
MSNAGTEHQFDDFLTALGSLRLAGQDSYTPSAGDTDAFAGDANGPLYSFYRATPSAARTIDGISVNLVGGGRGHVLVVVNDSSHALTFNTSVVANAKKILGDPVTIGQDGAVILVYDNTNAGWRIVTSFPGAPIAYTPAWTSSGTQPSLGAGTLTGSWHQVGRLVHYEIHLTMASDTTFGTGSYALSLPVTAISSDHPAGSALVKDASPAAFYIGVPVLSSGGTVVAIFTADGNLVAATAPITFADNDEIVVAGSYLRA